MSFTEFLPIANLSLLPYIVGWFHLGAACISLGPGYSVYSWGEKRKSLERFAVLAIPSCSGVSCPTFALFRCLPAGALLSPNQYYQACAAQLPNCEHSI